MKCTAKCCLGDVEEPVLDLQFCHKLMCKFSFNFTPLPHKVASMTVCLLRRHRLLSKRVNKHPVSSRSLISNPDSLKQGPRPWSLGWTVLECGFIGPLVVSDSKEVPNVPKIALCIRACSRSQCEITFRNILCMCPGRVRVGGSVGKATLRAGACV